jgi:hypothetical protein
MSDSSARLLYSYLKSESTLGLIEEIVLLTHELDIRGNDGKDPTIDANWAIIDAYLNKLEMLLGSKGFNKRIFQYTVGAAIAYLSQRCTKDTVKKGCSNFIGRICEMTIDDIYFSRPPNMEKYNFATWSIY